MMRRGIVIAAGLLLLGGSMVGVMRADNTRQGTLAGDNSGNDGETDGNLKFVIRQAGKQRYFDVYVNNAKIFTVKEQPVDVAEGGSGYIEDYPHDFHLSPDHKYLFVEQKSVHCYGVGTLYGPTQSGRMHAIRPHGMPFDTAAIHAFLRVTHIPAHIKGHRGEEGQDEAFGDETRVMHFDKWTPDGLDFSVGLANFYCGDGAINPGDTEYDWSGHYDFRTGRFTHIYITDTMTHARYEKEKDQR